MAAGRRIGGRQKGTPNKATADIAARLEALGCDPIAGMARLALDEANSPELRGKMFSELAQYVAPKRKAIEHSAEPGHRGRVRRLRRAGIRGHDRMDVDAPPRQLIAWKPGSAPQRALLACPAFEAFFGGARGGGKTDGILGEWAQHSGRYGEDAIGLMIRRTRLQLTETFERAKAIYRLLGATFTEAPMRCIMPNGARLNFAYLERDADAENYQGHSYTRIYIEEAGNFPSPTPILKLMAALRSGVGVCHAGCG